MDNNNMCEMIYLYTIFCRFNMMCFGSFFLRSKKSFFISSTFI